MAAHNRHIREVKNQVLAPVKGGTVIEAGDLVFRNALGSMTIAADNYTYPFNDAVNSASETTELLYSVHVNFLGVAMESSPSGTTENISIATAGKMRFPLYRIGGVTIGQKVSAVSTFASAAVAGVSKDTVIQLATTPGTTAYLGYVSKTESGASFVDFQIRTAFGSGTLITT